MRKHSYRVSAEILPAGEAGSSYVPTVAVITKKAGNEIEIRVEDNGNGIPQNIANNIFQPFSTTKPKGRERYWD